MGNSQPKGMTPLIFEVITFAQSIGLAQEFTSSTAKIAVWSLQGFQPISEARVQEHVAAPNILDAEVLAPNTCHREK